ncbi:MAG: hypothetical protein ACFB13_14190 [Kiloniellaceae bacterium]
MDTKARPWPDIVEFYRGLVEDHGWALEPMLALVRRIEVSPYTNGLVAYTSMISLAIAQSDANFLKGPELRIEFDHLESKQFTFTYVDRADAKNPWTRKAEADEGFEVLERFLVKRARWFRKPGEPESSSPSSA